MKISNKRKCIVTHKSYTKEELIRIVKLKNNTFLVDSNEPGRGAYVSKEASFDKIKNHRLLNRAFRTEVPNTVYDDLKKTMEG